MKYTVGDSGVVAYVSGAQAEAICFLYCRILHLCHQGFPSCGFYCVTSADGYVSPAIHSFALACDACTAALQMHSSWHMIARQAAVSRQTPVPRAALCAAPGLQDSRTSGPGVDFFGKSAWPMWTAWTELASRHLSQALRGHGRRCLSCWRCYVDTSYAMATFGYFWPTSFRV
ncbi:unnamed protein product [Effrenium voratum]|uniref:Uncharacterized protein n=1 Tax=Effrenium voratum TaxID=2562239 RepID=A0AA36MM45_9DINO|nr:unnamed protein product [Effrenium voratum]